MKRLTLSILLAGAAIVLAVPAVASVPTQEAMLTADDGAAFDQFGVRLAADENTMVVGAFGDDVGTNVDQGSAYVFTRMGPTWTQQAKLTAADGAAGDRFGNSVFLHNDTVVVGVQNDDSLKGSAYVFTRMGSTWTQQAKLTAADGAAGDAFGGSVAVQGDTVVVGAQNDDGLKGSAYVFTRRGSTWTQQAKLTAADGVAGDIFGNFVSLDNESAVVAADNSAGGQGSAYVFTRRGSTWTQQGKLTATDGAPGDRFGHSVAVHGETVLVGAIFDDVGTNVDQGSAYVFTRRGSTWTQQAKLTAADGAAGDEFGFFGSSVPFDQATLAVGALEDDVGTNVDQGSAYVFTRSGTTWTEHAKLTASDGAAFDEFGSAVDLVGDTAFVAARSDDVVANVDQGSAYVFVRVRG